MDGLYTGSLLCYVPLCGGNLYTLVYSNQHLGAISKQLKVLPVPAEARLLFSFPSPIQPACLLFKDLTPIYID